MLELAARGRLTRREVELPLGGPARLLYVSDLHLTPWHAHVVDQVLEQAHQCQPELVVLGGDLADLPSGLAQLERLIAHLPAPVLAVPGNHDRQLGLVRVGAALERAGARFADVVRTRIYVTDIGQWEVVGKAHAECFAAVRPACTMVEVVRLAAPEMLVEIEVDAVIGSGRAQQGRARATASAGNGDGDGGAVKAIPQARPRGPRPARPRPRTKAQRRAR